MSVTVPDLVPDETTQAADILARIAERIPGWEPSEGHLETALAEGVAMVVASAVAQLIDTSQQDILTGFGEGALGLTRQRAEPARGFADFRFSDRAGAVIPDGFELVMEAGDGTLVAFAVVGDVLVPTDEDTAVDVPIVALEPGSVGRGLYGAPAYWDDSLPRLESIVVNSPTTGGTDDEDEDAWRERVIRRARRFRGLPYTPDEYADAALDVPTVARCCAVNRLDLTDPENPEDDAIGHVALFPVDSDGNPLTGSAARALADHFAAMPTLMGVTVHIGEAEHVRFEIETTVRLEDGADGATVTSAIDAALTSAYSPATYGLDEEAPGRWRLRLDPISAYDVAALVADIDGVRSVVECRVDRGSEVRLTGWAPLPSVTVTTNIAS